MRIELNELDRKADDATSTSDSVSAANAGEASAALITSFNVRFDTGVADSDGGRNSDHDRPPVNGTSDNGTCTPEKRSGNDANALNRKGELASPADPRFTDPRYDANAASVNAEAGTPAKFNAEDGTGASSFNTT